MQRRLFLQTTLGVTPLLHQFTGMNPQSATSAETPVIINAGIGGNNTVDLLGRIEKDCLAPKPDLTLLMVGTNDMNSQKHVPLSDYRQNILTIVTKLTDARSLVLLMTVLPVYEPYLLTRHPSGFYAPEGHAARLENLNVAIRQVAADTGVFLFDMHHVFEKVGHIGLDSSSLLKNEANSHKKDGVHPTPDGYRTMAVALYPFLAQNRLLANRIVCFGDSITLGDKNGGNYPAYLQALVTP